MFTQGCVKNASVLFVGTCFLYQLCNQEYVNMIRCFSKKLYIYNTILHCVTKTYATGYFNMHNTITSSQSIQVTHIRGLK